MSSEPESKKVYAVVRCTRCGQLVLSRHGTKTRQCPYCGLRIDLAKAEVHSTTRDPEEARLILRSKRQACTG